MRLAQRNFSIIPILATALLIAVAPQHARSQGQTKWLQVGTLHNWFSEKGGEIEHGNVRRQQYGLQWPAQYDYQDIQAAKGFWIGTTNFTDERGTTYPFKVVHVGPRVEGDHEFFPERHDLFAQFEPPRVIVDGNPSFKNPEELTAIDQTLMTDRMLITKVNTSIGLTVERKIYASSQQHHDNYHIFELTFTNTGNPRIGLQAKALTGLMFYWQFRYSINQEVRYIVNNSAGWGINTMNDARGFPPDITNSLIPPGENDIKAQFAWHGLHRDANRPPAGSSPNAATFDNIGAPIWNPHQSAGFVAPSDTNWRLGGAQFAGYAHIRADRSATDKSDDPHQPTTTNYMGSDEPLTRNNSQFNVVMMEQEYAKMMEGHAPRHAWLVEPQGRFSEQTVMANIGVGAPGGFSSGMGYGPYNLAPGQSITIVFAEGVNGLTREECIRIGKMYKDGIINTKSKNDSVMVGRPRLLETLRKARANYLSGFRIPKPPYPPASFTVRGGGDKIALSWEPNPQESANGFSGYRIYRATGRPDSSYRLIFQAGGSRPANPNVTYVSNPRTYSFDDVTAVRGVSYYYYVSTFSTPIAADPTTRTPAGELESSRFYTQTYDPAFLKRPAGTSSSDIRIAPNPYIISSNENSLRFPNEGDKIAFFNIPGNCVIKIYTELGELIKEIVHDDGTGDAYWNSITSSNQVIVSGVYIVVIENKDTGERTMKKLVVIR
jgi:hypothetical protein